MTRISLKEAYDNRDVIAQIARLNDIIEDLPNPDLTNVVLKTGNQIIDGVKQFNDQVVLAGGMDLSGLGPTTINGDLEVNGDIIQSGAAYETHAEQVFSHNDYIVMRDGAVNSLPAGSYSGLQVKKYDGTNDCRLVVDNQGVARVGDINDEQPLATRDEVANMTSGALVKWDGVNKKMITTSSANVGDDSHPVKIVGGDPVAVSSPLSLRDWTEITNDLTKLPTAHEILITSREASTFTHSVLIPYGFSTTYVNAGSSGANYLNLYVTTGGITTISSNGTWDNIKVWMK